MELPTIIFANDMNSNEVLPESAHVRRAHQIIAAQRRVSISLLQRHLRIGYGAALDLLAQLSALGLVDEDANGCWMPTPAGLAAGANPTEERCDAQEGTLSTTVQLDDYVRQVSSLSAFLYELAEESVVAHPAAVALLKPAFNVGNTEVRDAMYRLYRTTKPRLKEAKLLLHGWLERYTGMTVGMEAAEMRLSMVESERDRPWSDITDQEQKIERSFLRLAHYLRQRCDECNGEETERVDPRLFDYFLPTPYVLRGQPCRRDGRQVHLVPPATLVRHCCLQFGSGRTSAEVAALLRRCVAVVALDAQQKHAIDQLSLEPGGGMPADWGMETGDVDARLRLACIDVSASARVK